MKHIFRGLIIFQFLMMTAGAVVYVDKSSPGGDGSSWAAAFNTLQPALDAAHDRGKEVWVAMGDYDEVRSFTGDIPGWSGEFDNGSLVLRNGVAMYGGFAGDETEREAREWENNVTIINGTFARSGGRACHVIMGADDAALDGFTVTGGHVDQFVACIGIGAGVVNSTISSMTYRNCLFTGNSALSGGAMANINSSIVIENCTFSENYSNGASAIVNYSSDITISKCRFVNNSAYGFRNYPSQGGAISNHNSSPFVVNCVFWQNTVDSPYYTSSRGGAVFNTDESFPEFLNCTFYGNIAANEETLYNTNSGGAVYSDETSIATLINCILWGNIPDQVYGPSLALYSNVQGGSDGAGCIDADPLFADVEGRLSPGSPCIDAGWADYAPSEDILGVARPFGAGIDMGAYEMTYPVVQPDFEIDVNFGMRPLSVQFTDTSVSTLPITSWKWRFGDGATSIAQNPRHVYRAPGLYSVSLTITAGGKTATVTKRQAILVTNRSGRIRFPYLRLRAVNQPRQAVR